MVGCGADTDANALMTSLLAGENLTIPAIDFNGADFTFPYDNNSEIFAPLAKLTNDDLTTKVIDGSGTFDVLMTAAMAHLKGEFLANRISGAEYTKAYIATIQSAMQFGVTFLIERDTAFWQSQTAQIAALKAKVDFAVAKIQGAAEVIQAENYKATFALTKLKMATESAQYCTAEYQLTTMLPTQLALVKEQIETARGSTLDTRTDGSTISGSIGSQKALYAQQIVSYKRDAEVKASKLFTDAWITMKTIDEGLDPPNGFTNVNLDQLLTTLIINNGLGTGEIPAA